jgi:hypothetical protein
MRSSPRSVGYWRPIVSADQFGEHNNGSTLRATASQTDATGKRVALGTPLLTDGSRLAGGAFVHRVLEEALLSLEFSAKQWRVQTSWLQTTRSICVLLAGSRAIALLRCAQRNSTDQARG